MSQGKQVSKEVENSTDITNNQTRKGIQEVNKLRPISLLDVGGKELEKVLINRINHHVYSNGSMNENQYGFRSQKLPSTQIWKLKFFWNKVWQEEK